VNEQKGMANHHERFALKTGVVIIGWAAVIGLLLYRPIWVGAGFAIGLFGSIFLALLVLYFGFVFLKAKEAKREGGWLLAILTAIGVMIFIALWFLLGFHVEKRHLPL